MKKEKKKKKKQKTTAKLQYQCPLMLHSNFELYNLSMYVYTFMWNCAFVRV